MSLTAWDIGGCGCNCGGGGCTCGSCTIPAADMTASWTGGAGSPSTLHFRGCGETWITDYIADAFAGWAGFQVVFGCSDGAFTMTVADSFSGLSCNLTIQGDSTCSPFHLHGKPTSGAGSCDDLTAAGFTDFYADE